MLESEKEEINRWLRQKWPEVFVDGLIDKIYAKSLEASKLKEDIKKVDETLASHLKEHENSKKPESIPKSEWISTRKKLPPIGKSVLVIDLWNKVFQKKRTNKFSYLWTGKNGLFRSYLFWMELPYLPSKEEIEKERLK